MIIVMTGNLLMPKSIKDRQQSLRERRKSEGLKRVEYYATPNEHDQIKAILAKLRERHED